MKTEKILTEWMKKENVIKSYRIYEHASLKPYVIYAFSKAYEHTKLKTAQFPFSTF
jgi:hypothetical protein